MLDGPHPVGDCADDRLRDVGMGQYIGPARLRLLADGPDLAGGVLGVVDRVGGRRDPASGHDLDLVGALAKLVPGRAPALVDAVGDAAELLGGCLAGAGDDIGGRGPRAEVRVPAGLGEREAGDEEAGADEQAVLHRIRHPPVGPARVPHGREPPHQHRLHELAGVGGHVGDRNVVDGGEVEVGRLDVHVGVDEARHEGPAGEVDRPVRRARRDGPVGDLLDPLPLDENVVSLAALGRLPVEDARVGEQDAGHGPPFPPVPNRGPHARAAPPARQYTSERTPRCPARAECRHGEPPDEPNRRCPAAWSLSVGRVSAAGACVIAVRLENGRRFARTERKLKGAGCDIGRGALDPATLF